MQRRPSRRDPPKTVENRGFPQVIKVQYRLGKITNLHNRHREQSHLHVHLCDAQEEDDL